MIEGQAPSEQQELTHPVALSEETVVAAFPVGGVANHRVEDVVEMAPNLVTSARLRSGPHQGVAAGGITGYPHWKLDPGKALKTRDRLAAAPTSVGQGIVDNPFRRRITPHEGEILLSDLPISEQRGESARGIRRTAEHEDTRRGAVEAVDRKEALAQTVSRRLQQRRLAGGHTAAMHEHAWRLVDGHEMVVQIQDSRRGIVGALPARVIPFYGRWR